MNEGPPTTWNATESNLSPPSPPPAPPAGTMPNTLPENAYNRNSINNLEVSAGSNSSSSSVRVNSHLASFAGGQYASTGAAPEALTALVSDDRGERIEDNASLVLASSTSEACETYIGACAHLVQRYLAYFDGTSATLRFCHGASVPSRPGLKTPEGYQDFTFAWSGIAFAVFRKILTDELPDKAAVRELASLGISVHAARVRTAEALVPCVGDVIGSRRYSHDSTASYAQSIQDCSAEMMRRWVASQPALPSDISANYTHVEDEVKSVDDLDALLMQTMMVWVTSFFPLCQSLKRQGGGSDIRFFWYREAPSGLPSTNTFVDSIDTITPTASPPPPWTQDGGLLPRPAVVLPDDDFLFSVYSFCSYENRMVDAAGSPRGCVVPRRWLQQFTEWLIAAVRHREAQGREPSQANEDLFAAQQDESAAAVVPPGPLNTFQCVELAAGAPNRHWLAKGKLNGHGVAEAVEAYDVVPEGLFDVFALRFGCGPKYMTYAPCTCLAQLVEVTRPQSVRATVRCSVVGDPTPHITAVVGDALLRTPLNELLRVALCRHVTPASSRTDANDVTVTAAGAGRRDFSWWLQAGLTAETRELEIEVTVHAPPQSSECQNEESHGDVTERASETFHTLLDSTAFMGTGTILQAVQTAYSAHGKVFVPNATELQMTLEVRAGAASDEANSAVSAPGVCGLTNVGNTCYMNSALQALSNVRCFREAFFGTMISRFPRATIAQAYMMLMLSLWSGRFDYAETYTLKRILGECVPRFAGYDQQDANELVEVLLDHLSEELNTVSSKSYRERLDSDAAIPTRELAQIFWEDFLLNNKSFVPRQFFHQSKTVFTCLSCGTKTRVFDNNLTLGLPIKEAPVQKLVRVNVLVDCDVSALLPTCSATTTVAEQDHACQLGDAKPPPVLPTTHVRIPVCPSVQVAVQPNNGIDPADLSAALTSSLQRSASLKTRIHAYAAQLQATSCVADAQSPRANESSAVDEEASSPAASSASCPPATDVVVNNTDETGISPEVDTSTVAEGFPALSLDFSFNYLEKDLSMQCKPIVWARCTARHASPGNSTAATPSVAPAAAPPASTPSPPPPCATAPDTAVCTSPQLRVWYFLQHHTSFNDFQRSTLLYPAHVEELSVPPAFLAPPNTSTSASEEEEESSSVAPLHSAGALSRHILAVGQAVGDALLMFNNVSNAGPMKDPELSPSTRCRGANTGAVVPSAGDKPAGGGSGGRQWQSARADTRAGTSTDSDSSFGTRSSRSSDTAEPAETADSSGSSCDGDDEREAKSSVWTPLPNPVDVCFASLRDTRLRPVASTPPEGSDAWLCAEWAYEQDARKKREPEINAKQGAAVSNPTADASSLTVTSPEPVNVLVFVCYNFCDARVVQEFSPVVITHPPLGKDCAPRCALSDCLARASQVEKLSDDDAWYCPRCKELREAVVERTLFRLPPCLIMCFKRFKTHSLRAEKNNTLISFPTELDMTPHLDVESVKDSEAPFLYRLRAVVYHTGSLSYGHYTASAFNDSVNKWVYYNDTRATVEESEEPGAAGAYILCYERL